MFEKIAFQLTITKKYNSSVEKICGWKNNKINKIKCLLAPDERSKPVNHLFSTKSFNQIENTLTGKKRIALSLKTRILRIVVTVFAV